MNVWPASLPQKMNLSGYRSGFGEGRLLTPTDSGPGKARRRFSFVPRQLSCQTKLTNAQLVTFEAFVEDTLAGGVLPFQMPRQEGAGTMIVKIGQSMPSWTALPGMRWLVAMELLILS